MCFVLINKYVNFFSREASNRKYNFFLQKIPHENVDSIKKCSENESIFPKNDRLGKNLFVSYDKK